ncbi:MAG: PQQ-binding-like beta-propeller repeat protein [Myxococcales bacterium]|nr:PQQ-binding-like beta-propeller repeat protein [Myxococcales bacterium]MDD9969043.1 PQQ-binding-like beta-propeller repeat protein [Myxococcales bacterium]
MAPPGPDTRMFQALGLAGICVASGALFLRETPQLPPLAPLSALADRAPKEDSGVGPQASSHRSSWTQGLGARRRVQGKRGPRSGRLRFAFRAGGAITGRAALDGDGNVYFAAHDGWLYALTADGRLRFRKQLSGKSFGGPTATSNGMIVVGTDAGVLHGFDTRGTERLTYRAASGIDSAPTEAIDGGLLFGAGHWVIALAKPHPTLESGTPTDARWRFRAHSRVFASPAQDPNGRIYVTAQDHRVYALDAATGEVLFSHTLARDLDAPPLLVGERVYVAGDGGQVAAVSSHDGRPLFNVRVDGHVRGPMMFGRDALWLQTMGMRPALLALDPDDGSVLAGHRFPLADSTEVGSRSGPVMDRSGHVYVGGPDGAVYGFGTDGNIMFRFPTGGDVHAPPTLGPDGTLYIGSGDGSLYALSD